MGETAPEENTAWQRFDFGQNTCTRCRETGNGFKQGVNIIRNRTAEKKGKRTEKREKDPTDRNGNKALFCIDLSVFWFENKGYNET